MPHGKLGKTHRAQIRRALSGKGCCFTPKDRAYTTVCQQSINTMPHTWLKDINDICEQKGDQIPKNPKRKYKNNINQLRSTGYFADVIEG